MSKSENDSEEKATLLESGQLGESQIELESPMSDINIESPKSSKLPNKSLSTLINESSNNKPKKQITNRIFYNILIVYFSVWLDNMGVSIVQPILPYYADMFNANSVQLGMLYSSYSLMATFATIFMAKGSDYWGRRPMIMFSLFGTMSGFLLTGLAWDYWSLLAFRFYTGAFGGSFSVAQAYLTDVCPNKVLDKYMAALGGVIAIAFVIGPLLGGGLWSLGPGVPFYASSGAGFVGFLVSIIWLQESMVFDNDKNKNNKKNDDIKTIDDDDEELQNINNKQTQNKNDETNENNITKEFPSCWSLPYQVWLIIFAYFLSTLGWTSFTSMFAKYMQEIYNLNSTQNSIITTIIGTVYAISNVFIFTTLNKYIGSYNVGALGLIICGISLILSPITKNAFGILAFMCFGVATGYGVLMPAFATQGNDYTNNKNTGIVLGSIIVGNQLAMVFGPLIHGALYAYQPDYIFYMGGVMVLAGLIFEGIILIIWPETRKPKEYEIITKELAYADYMKMDPKKWKYEIEKPTNNDFKKLGKEFGMMLTNRGYPWKKYYKQFANILDEAFPPLRTDNLHDYVNDCHFIKEHLIQTRWEFDHLRNMGDIHFM